MPHTPLIDISNAIVMSRKCHFMVPFVIQRRNSHKPCRSVSTTPELDTERRIAQYYTLLRIIIISQSHISRYTFKLPFLKSRNTIMPPAHRSLRIRCDSSLYVTTDIPTPYSPTSSPTPAPKRGKKTPTPLFDGSSDDEPSSKDVAGLGVENLDPAQQVPLSAGKVPNPRIRAGKRTYNQRDETTELAEKSLPHSGRRNKRARGPAEFSPALHEDDQYERGRSRKRLRKKVDPMVYDRKRNQLSLLEEQTLVEARAVAGPKVYQPRPRRPRSGSFDPRYDPRPQAPEPQRSPSRLPREAELKSTSLQSPRAASPNQGEEPQSSADAAALAYNQKEASVDDQEASVDDGPLSYKHELIPGLFIALCYPGTPLSCLDENQEFTHVVHIAMESDLGEGGSSELMCNPETGVQTLCLVAADADDREFGHSDSHKVRTPSPSALLPAQLATARDFISLALPYRSKPKSREVQIDPDAIKPRPKGSNDRAKVLIVGAAYLRLPYLFSSLFDCAVWLPSAAAPSVMEVAVSYLAYTSGECVKTVVTYIETERDVIKVWRADELMDALMDRAEVLQDSVNIG